MKKINLKIMLLVVASLFLLGSVMGTVSVLYINYIGDKNLQTLDRKLREDFDMQAKSQVESAVSIINKAYSRKDTIGLEAAVNNAASYVRDIRYGENGYIFVYDSKGNTVILLGGKAEGSNRWDLKDSAGNYLVRDLIKAAKDGTGFTTYWYPKPGEEEALPKRAYNQYFQPFDWIVGTGNYIDDIDKIINSEADKLNTEIMKVTIVLIIIDILLIGLSSAAAWILGRKISRPVELIANDAVKIAAGDLTVNIDVKGNDETAILADLLMK